VNTGVPETFNQWGDTKNKIDLVSFTKGTRVRVAQEDESGRRD